MQMIVARTKRGAFVEQFDPKANPTWFDRRVRTLSRIYGVLVFEREEVPSTDDRTLACVDAFRRFGDAIRTLDRTGPFRDCRPPDCR